MDQQNEELVPKASEQCEPPSSKVTGEEDATLSGVGVTAPAVKIDLTPATGSLGTVGPRCRRLPAGCHASAINLFGHQDLEKVKNHRTTKRKRKKPRREEQVSVTGVLVHRRLPNGIALTVLPREY